MAGLTPCSGTERGTIYLANLDQCEPQGALSREYEIGRWTVVDFESDTFAGKMLFAGEEADAPEITYPLRIAGWHGVSIGVYQERFMGPAAVQLRLSGDPAFTVLMVEEGPTRILEEVFWKVADLTGQTITFKQLRGAINKISATFDPDAFIQAKVAYIRLDPLSDAQVQTLLAERNRGDSRRLFAHDDAGLAVIYMRDGAPEEIYRQIEPYRDTDFSRLYWEAGAGDTMNYPSKIGRVPTLDTAHSFPRVVDRVYVENWRLMRDKGLDPFKAALDYSHEIGLEFHAAYRPAGFYSPPFEDIDRTGARFYDLHPELRAVTRDGSPAPRLAYTYPEARRYVLSLLRETALYPVDGICLLYVRRPPLVGYEAPLVEGFMAEYGQDPRQLDEREPRWLAYRCRILTQFMREVRQEMDAVAREQKRLKRIEVTAMVSGREDENFFYGMNLKEWVDQRLVDTIIPYTMAPQLDSMAVSWADVRDAKYWVNLAKGTPCKVAFSVLPRFMPSEEFRRMAATLYRAGAEHLFFWDCAARINYSNQHQWNAVRRLGHRDEIEAWMKAGQPSPVPTQKTLKRLGDWNMAYETPG